MPPSDKSRTRRCVSRSSIIRAALGKTTLTVNIAAALARLGNRVLLVDTDPQCNLSSFLLDESVLDDKLANSDSEAGSTIWSAIKPVAEGLGDVLNLRPVERSIENLFLACGDIRLSEFEEELTSFWSDCLQRKMRGFRGSMALSRLVNQMCVDQQIDVVFYDCGPNIGPLNRIILLDCDGFIIPAACDQFSLCASERWA